MTAPVCDADVSEMDLGIECEWSECPCSDAAIVLCKGCCDDRHYSLCQGHLSKMRQWFESQKPAWCECNRPFIFFETHYSLEFF